MANEEPKKGKKPSGHLEEVNVAMGQEHPPAEEGEVTGHMVPPVSPGINYICWNDAALNFVPRGWVYFICWRCGALNT